MIKKLACLVLCLPLAGCFDPSRPILAEALNSFAVPQQETDGLELAGIELNANQGSGLSIEQAEALFRVHQGKPAHYTGILEKIKVTGNKADIELYPVRVSFAIRDCNRAKSGTVASDCHIQNRSLVSVTCRVNDWAALNQKTGGNMPAALALRLKERKNSKAYPLVHMEGILQNLQPAKKTILIHRGGSDFTFGVLPGTRGVTANYGTFLVKNCNIRGYDFKLVR